MQHKIKRYTCKTWLRRNSLYFILIGVVAFIFWAGFATKTVIYKVIEFEESLQRTGNVPQTSPVQNPTVYLTEAQKDEIRLQEVSTSRPVAVLSGSSTKSYMSYKKITDKTSPQWQFIHTQQGVSVREDGYLVTPDGYIGVALGSYFGDIGEKYLFELDSGAVLKLIKVEAKDDRDTCKDSYMADDGSVIELVVDPDKMQEHVWSNGLVWQGNFNNNPDFKGRIVNIWSVDNE